MTDKFNIVLVHDEFVSSLCGEDDVNLTSYLNSYEELNKFCNLMGMVFGFVSKDLRSKMDILYEFLNNQEVADHFQTVKKMIEYEQSNNLLTKKDYTSGSRTLLRLHRGLDFIQVFLKNLSNLKEDDNTSSICRSAYDETLSHHHTFVVRHGARLAMHTMPNKENLLIKVCGDNSETIEATVNSLPKMLEVGDKVFSRINNLYTVNNLHSLP